jgi:hypothetical protein
MPPDETPVRGAAAGRVAMVVALSCCAIELHELAHLAAYAAFGIPARLGFQRVDPLVPVHGPVRAVALLAGPAASLAAAAILLAVARRRGGFGWATAAFTNASLRLFPLAMDLSRALRGAPPFSDEAEAALALSAGRGARVAMVPAWLVACALLTVAAGRAYRFGSRPVLKCAAIYLLSLAVGILAVVIDDLRRG